MGQLVVVDSNSLTTSVALSGAGFAPIAPALSSNSLDFGNVEIGVPSVVQSITVTPQNSHPVKVQLQGSTDYTVLPLASCADGAVTCQINVNLNPSADTAVAASIVVTDTTNNLSSTASLSGIGYGNTGAMSALAYYLPLTDGSGTTLHDISGNNKNATISGTGIQAVWPANAPGLELNDQTAVIPNASGLATFGYCAYFPAATSAAFTNYLFDLSYYANGYNGYNLGTSSGIGIGHGNEAYFPEIGRSNGAPSTLSAVGMSGNHCVEAVIGDSSSGILDRIFVDGTEVAYLIQGTTDDAVGGSQLTNSMYLQTNGRPGFRLPISLYSVWGASARDTSNQAMARAKSETARLKNLGTLFGFPILNATDSTCSITGTSLDVGFFASHAPSALLNLDFPCTLNNFAVSGQTSKEMVAGYEDREATVYHPLAARNIAFNGGAINDFIYQESPQDALQDMIAWNNLAHSQGYKTVVVTITSRCGSNGYLGLTGDAYKQQYNALLLAAADQFDYVANPAAAPQIGADNACSNSAYFADAATGLGTHFSDAGQAFYVAAERAGFEGVYRSSQTSISGTYSQVPSDTQIIASNATPFSISLMDANTGNFNKYGTVCVSNTGSAQVTLEAVSGQTVGGAATLSVTVGNQVCIKPTVADPISSGASWMIIP